LKPNRSEIYINNNIGEYMGYTNYWHQDMDFTDKEWKEIQSEVQYIKEMGENVIDVHSEDKEIIINGKPGCETFVLNKNKPTVKEYKQQDLTFNCCKTRELPYDIYVWHLLVFCAGMVNDVNKFSISRDR